MKLNTFSGLAAAAAIGAFAFAPIAAHASSTGTLSATATISSSATLTLGDTAGTASTLTFAGVGGQNVSPSEGVITVTAQVTTDSANSSTKITVLGEDLSGVTSGNTIPVACLSYTNTVQSGGGTWHGRTLSAEAQTVATLPGSGTYTGDQSYNLAIPANANADTYTGNVTYAIVGF